MKMFVDLDAIDLDYTAHYDSACEIELEEEQVWAGFASAAFVDNEGA